jgi:hypothetical protein
VKTTHTPWRNCHATKQPAHSNRLLAVLVTVKSSNRTITHPQEDNNEQRTALLQRKCRKRTCGLHYHRILAHTAALAHKLAGTCSDWTRTADHLPTKACGSLGPCRLILCSSGLLVRLYSAASSQSSEAPGFCCSHVLRTASWPARMYCLPAQQRAPHMYSRGSHTLPLSALAAAV